jgi:hypothetical protein
MPGLDELLAMNEAPDAPAPAGPAPAEVPPPLDELLRANEAPDELAAAPAPAEVPPAPKMVRVIAPDQVTEGSIPADQAEQAYLEGYQVITPEMEAERRLQEEYGDTGGKIVSGVQGFARGVTFGASDYLGRVASGVAGALAAPDVPRLAGRGIDAPLAEGPGLYDEAAADQAGEDIAKYRAANPVTAGVSEVVGAVAPAILSGGTSTAATAARLTPAGQLANLGMKFATVLGKKAAERGLGAAGRIGASALAAGVEGAADNAARSVFNDLAQGDVDGVAERMVDAAWDGMKWGALLGGGFTSIGEGISALRARKAAAPTAAADELAPPPDVQPSGRPLEQIDADIEAANQRLAQADTIGEQNAVADAEAAVNALHNEREAAVGQALGLKTNADIELNLKVDDPQTLTGWAGFKQKLTKVKTAKELEQRFDDEVEKLTRTTPENLDEIARIDQTTVAPYIGRHKKPLAIKGQLAQEGVQWDVGRAGRILDDLDSGIKELDNLLSKDGIYTKNVKREFSVAKEVLEKGREHLVQIKGSGPISPESMILRGDLDAVASVYFAYDSFKSILGRYASQQPGVVSASEAALQRLYMRMRGRLQDPSFWGNALADFQTADNAAISKAIPARKVFINKFGVSSAELQERAGEHGFDVLLEADPGKVEGLYRKLGDASAYKDERDYINGLIRGQERIEVASRYYPMSDEARAAIVRRRELVEKEIANLRATKTLKLQKDAAVRLAKEHQGLDKVMTAMDALGAFLPGVHLVGKSIGTAAEAVHLAGSVEELGKGAVKQEQAAQSAARSAVRNFMDKVKLPDRLPGVGITGNQVRRAIEDARALEDENSEQSQNLSRIMQDVASESPELAQALEAQVRAKAAFILSKVGPEVDDSDPFQPKPMLLDPITERAVANYVDAARNPSHALQRLAHGTGTKEDKETLKALYPARYDRFVKGIVSEVRARKVPPTPEQREQLYWATGVPMSREQQPEYTAAIQQMYAEEPEQGGPQQAQQPAPQKKPKAAPLDFEADQLMARSDAIMTPGGN